MAETTEASRFPRRVSRRPQLRSLLDQQQTLGNRAVLRLIGVQPTTLNPIEPPEAGGPDEPGIAAPSPQHDPEQPPLPNTTPHEPPPQPRRKWLLGFSILVVLALLEAARRWLAS